MFFFKEGIKTKNEMDYKSKKVKGKVMNKKIKINETMIEDVHYKILRHSQDVESHVPGSKKGIDGSSMFMVTIYPIGGLKDSEIDILIHFILSASWIMYYGIGIEVIKRADGTEWKHMHISFVTNIVTNVKGIKAFFHGLIDERRMLSIPNKIKDTGTIENVSLKIESCGSNFFDTKTPMAQCAYALKGAGIGKTRDEITEADYNNKTTRWCNLFDDEKECTDEVEQQQWDLNRIAFAHLLVKEEKKQKSNPPLLIHKKYHIEAAEKYAKDNDMEWSDNIEDGTHVHVLATMVTSTGDTRYELAPGFLNTAIQDDLNCQKKRTNYKTILEETLVAHFKGVKAKAARALAKAAAGGVTTTTREKNKLINALKLQNQELVSERQELNEKIHRLQEEKKKQDATISQLQAGNVKASQTITTLKTTLDERDTELFTAIREGKDYVKVGIYRRQKVYKDDAWNHIAKANNKRYKQEYRNENIEHWRSKKTLKRKAVAAAPAAPIAPPVRKRQKLHECGECEGCSDENKARCALSQNLKVYMWE